MEEYKDVILGICIDTSDHISEVEAILIDAGYARMDDSHAFGDGSIVAYPIDPSIRGFERLEYGRYATAEPLCEQKISSTNFIAKYGSSVSKSN